MPDHKDHDEGPALPGYRESLERQRRKVKSLIADAKLVWGIP